MPRSLNALSVDLEEHFQVSNFDRVIDRNSWDHQESRLLGPTHRLLDAFDEVNQTATFFVLGWVAERHSQLLREIADRGHEIACHGFDHALVYHLGPSRFRQDVRRARRAIEDACGARVRGYRAPSYSVTAKSIWALNILAEEGFTFDSSIFPIRHPRYGIPTFSRRPVTVLLPGGRQIHEFPLTTLRVGALNLPVAGGAYLRFLPTCVFRWSFARLQRMGWPTVLYVHPWELDPDQPRYRVSWRTRVNHYHNLDRLEGKLRTLLDAFDFAPMGAVLDRLKADQRLPAIHLAGRTGERFIDPAPSADAARA